MSFTIMNLCSVLLCTVGTFFVSHCFKEEKGANREYKWIKGFSKAYIKWVIECYIAFGNVPKLDKFRFSKFMAGYGIPVEQ